MASVEEPGLPLGRLIAKNISTLHMLSTKYVHFYRDIMPLVLHCSWLQLKLHCDWSLKGYVANYLSLILILWAMWIFGLGAMKTKHIVTGS